MSDRKRCGAVSDDYRGLQAGWSTSTGKDRCSQSVGISASDVRDSSSEIEM